MDLTIHKARPQKPLTLLQFQTWQLPDGELWAEFFREKSNYIIRFPNYADFRISCSGLIVDAWPTLSVDRETLIHLYLNQVQPLALTRQKKLVLHASAVTLDEQAVAFLGESGAGKSTLAVSFSLDGNAVLTDDGMELHYVNGVYYVQPSHPSVRLWEDTEKALVPRSVARSGAVQFTEKLRFLAGGDIRFEQQPRPLKRLYLLSEADGNKIEITQLTGHRPMIELVKNSFLLDVDLPEMLKHHFSEIVRIVTEIPLYSLAYPRNYEALSDLKEAVRAHLD